MEKRANIWEDTARVALSHLERLARRAHRRRLFAETEAHFRGITEPSERTSSIPPSGE